MNNEHMISVISLYLKEHYNIVNERIVSYSFAIQHAMDDMTRTAEFRANEQQRLYREMQNYVDNQAVAAEEYCKGVFDKEKAKVADELTKKIPTREQTELLNTLKNTNLTQQEFDAYIPGLKGVYLNEKALAAIAEEKGLKYDFTPLSEQMKRIEKFEDMM